MALKESWSSSASIIHINDCNTMALSTKLSLPTCVNAEIKKQTTTKRGQNRNSKQVTEDDMPLAILAYQKGLFIDSRTSILNPPLSPSKPQRKKRHLSSTPKISQCAASPTRSLRESHYPGPPTTAKEMLQRKGCHGSRYSFPVTENEQASLRHFYRHENNKKIGRDLHHHHFPQRRTIKSTFSCKSKDQNDKLLLPCMPTLQIHSPPPSPLSKKNNFTTSSDDCTTAAVLESCPPKSKATCFSCFMLHRWFNSPLNKMFRKTK